MGDHRTKKNCISQENFPEWKTGLNIVGPNELDLFELGFNAVLELGALGDDLYIRIIMFLLKVLNFLKHVKDNHFILLLYIAAVLYVVIDFKKNTRRLSYFA